MIRNLKFVIVFSGILLVLPFSLLNLEWVVWFALVPLLIATLRVNARDSFVLGYLCGVVWNTGSLFWMHVYDPLVLPLVVLILSFYPALFCLGLNVFCRGRIHPTQNDLVNQASLRGMKSQSNLSFLDCCVVPNAFGTSRNDRMMWAAPLLWVSLEYVRSLGFLGFPWNSLGYSQYRQISVIQMAEFTGVFGVSFLIVFVNSGIASVIINLRRHIGVSTRCKFSEPRKELLFEPVKNLSSRCAFAYSKNKGVFYASKIIAIVCVVLGLWLLWGNYALKKPSREEGEPLRAVLIQGNFGTDCYWGDNSADIMGRLSALSLGSAVSGPDLIIWAETAIGENPETAFAVNSRLRMEISRMLSETGACLLTGAQYNCGGRDYNSVFLISPACEVIDRYDKMHLVPAAEYFPFWRHTGPIEYLLRNAGDFTPGVRRTIFEIPEGVSAAADGTVREENTTSVQAADQQETDRGQAEARQKKVRFGVLICFEGIFGDSTRKFVKDGAEFLVNITNDVWSGSETSHHQHAAIASFRAVENRVYLLRLGNSGISRVINPYGIVEKELGAYRSGVLAGEVFPVSGQTFYTRHGDVFARVVLALTSLLFFCFGVTKNFVKITACLSFPRKRESRELRKL